MNDQQIDVHPTVKVARDLREITDELYPRLLGHAVHHGGSRLMPGGAAMVALGSVANMEGWENRQQATERHQRAVEGYRRAYTSVADEDPDDSWSAFQLLEFWSERWRVEHDMEFEPGPLRPRPTVQSEAAFLRWAVNWAWDHEAHWDDFAGDVNRARVLLENILRNGKAHERSRIECDRCDAAPRLLVFRGVEADGGDDKWKCPNCGHRFGADEVSRAHAKMLRSAGAERWVLQADAISLLKDQGRPDRTVRQWLAEGEGEGYCDPVTHEVWVWWPALWRKHLMTPTRQRKTTQTG